MKSATLWLLAGGMLLAVIVGLGWWLGAEEAATVQPDSATASASGVPRTLPGSQEPMLPASGVTDPVPMSQGDTALLPLPEQQVDAIESMSNARLKGDPLTPPVAHSPQGEAATAAELADPKAYQRYEARQNQRVYAAYIKAAAEEIPRLQADIIRARREGISPAEIAQGEEKLRRIQAMRDQLQADHPEAAAAP